ncbi:MAG: hypothetical protein AAF824_08330 [Bacteroidota bacterium]
MSTRTRNFWILTTFVALGFAVNNWFNFPTQTSSCHHSYSYSFQDEAMEDLGYSSFEDSWTRHDKTRRATCNLRSTCNTNTSSQVRKQAFPINKYEVKKDIGNPLVDETGGYVLMRVKVNEQGEYVAHKIMVEGNKFLADACERHIDKLIFTPAYENGMPVESWVSVSFNF